MVVAARTPKRAFMLISEMVAAAAGRQRAAEPRKRAVVLAFGVGRMVVAAAAGRGQVEPRKRAVVLAFGVGKMVVAAREYRNPENELNVLVFRIGQLVDWLTVCRIIF